MINPTNTPSITQQRDQVKQDLGSGIFQQYANNGQIVIFSMDQKVFSYRAATDTWTNGILVAAQSWPENKPFLIMHDFGPNNISFSPYARQKTTEIMENPVWKDRKIQGFTAMVLPSGFIRTLLLLFARQIKQENVTVRFFTSRREALTWLETFLQP